MNKIISSNLLTSIENYHNKINFDIDFTIGEGAELLMQICSFIENKNFNEFIKEAELLFSLKYPELLNAIRNITTKCNCDKYPWGPHICPFDIGKENKSDIQKCKCCPFCQQRCFLDSEKEKNV